MSNLGRQVFVFVALVALLSVGVAPAAVAASDRPFELTPPVSAAVIDPFRLPNGPYGAGNRGLEYGTVDGAKIVAAAPGVVAFAGPVGGRRFVSIDHGNGWRTTYGFVGPIAVRRGRTIERGDIVARAEGPFHFTVRIDGQYVDPAPLLVDDPGGHWRVRVRLIDDSTGLTGRTPRRSVVGGLRAVWQIRPTPADP